MATLKVTLGVVNITDPVLFVMREVGSPMAEVYTRLFNPPPASSTIFTTDEVNPVNHYCDWYRSNSEGDKIQLLHTTEVDVRLNKEVSFTPLEFVVNGGNTDAPSYDPEGGQNEYHNPDLVGKSYVVFRPGYGPLSWDTMIEPIDTGGFKYRDETGLVFEDLERYVLLISTVTESGSGGIAANNFPADFLEFSEDRSFDSSYYNKMLEANGSATLLTLTIDDMSLIPERTVFGVNTHQGDQSYVVIELPNDCFAWVLGKQRQKIYIGKGEEVKFMKKGEELKIVYWDGDYRRVGERVKQDGYAPINSVPETGGWVVFDSVIRLKEWYVDELPTGELGSGTQDVTPTSDHRGKFIIGSTKLWIPDSAGLFDRATDPDGIYDSPGRKAGAIQQDEVKSHNHNRSNDSGGDNYGLVPTSTSGSKTAGSHDSTGNGQEPNVRDSPKLMTDYGGAETRPKNRATNVYRII